MKGPRTISLWRIYKFAYVLGVRAASLSHLKDVMRLLLEPCNYWRNVEVPVVLSHLGVRPGERVLDIGSPKLPSLFTWNRLDAEVWATDLFPYFFEEYSHYRRCLQTTNSEATYHIETQDARKLTYPDSYFDKVYSISVLEHIEDDGDSLAMREIARVLKPGGLCCLTVPFARYYREETIVEEIYYKKPIDGKPVFYQRAYDEVALHGRLISPSGLRVSSLEYYGERWVPYEGLYENLPPFIRIPISFLGPVFSNLFLHRVTPGADKEAKAAILVLRKTTSPL